MNKKSPTEAELEQCFVCEKEQAEWYGEQGFTGRKFCSEDCWNQYLSSEGLA